MPSAREQAVIIADTRGSSTGSPAAEAIGGEEAHEHEVVAAAAATAEVLPALEREVPPAAESGERTEIEVEARKEEADEPPPASEKRIATVRPVRFGEDTLIDARPPKMDEVDQAEDEPAALLPASVDPNMPISKSTLIMGSSRVEHEEKKEEKNEKKEEPLALSAKPSDPPPAKKEDTTLLSATHRGNPGIAGIAEIADQPVPKDTTPGLFGKEKDTTPGLFGKKEEEKVIVARDRAFEPERREHRAVSVSVEPTPTPSGMALPIEDEVSVPPIVGEPSLERFFSEGDLSRHAEEVTEEIVPEKLKQKLAPHVVQRRARFARYVTWAVGISAVVCLAAVARTAISPKAVVAPRAAVAVPIVKEEPKPVAVAVAEPPKVEAKEAQPVAVDPKAADPKAEATPAPATDAPKAADAPAVVEPPAGDAKEEKKACKKALNMGKIKDAIDAGERSVAIDPTDGEAWLLLGASYQEMGKLAEARRCYTACVKEGKTGPRNECAKMLR